MPTAFHPEPLASTAILPAQLPAAYEPGNLVAHGILDIIPVFLALWQRTRG